MIGKTLLAATLLASYCLLVSAVPAPEQSDRFCVDEFQWGCTKSSDCCNEEHKCYILDGPSDLNGLLGRCQPPEENRVQSNTCIEDHQVGCHSVSGFECCNDDFMCINSRCQPVPTILANEEKFCVEEFQWGCTQDSDCCSDEHECFMLPPSDMNGLLGRCQRPEEPKIEANTCIKDHQLGCHSVSGFECCNDDFMCINSRCQPVPTILTKEEKTCLEDHEFGCNSGILGSECCNEDRMCINNRCHRAPIIEAKEEKFCVEEFQWGCTEDSDCCSEEHVCYMLPPSDLNGLLGRCQKPEEPKVEANTCVADHQLGCHSVSGFECCNDDFMCINSRCQPVPTILANEEKFCVEEFQWGCTQDSDCCSDEHECFMLPPSDMNGLLGRCQRPEEPKVEANTCVEDHQLGCHSVSGFECCNDDFMCINSRCQPVPTILAKEEKSCVTTWGCRHSSECCNKDHKCHMANGPSDLNGLLGRCDY